MRIAAWNVERLKHHRALNELLFACERTRADILVLTETDSRLCPPFPYSFHTASLSDLPGYRPTENRVSLFTRYRPVRTHPTYDDRTALCVELETERGKLLVYGTIMGIQGGRCESFKVDVPRQLEDIRRFSEAGHALCVCGDFNCSFSDGYYFTKAGRALLLKGCADARLQILTAGRPECIDHIALSEAFVNGGNVRIEEWNTEKTLSDHKGIVVELA